MASAHVIDLHQILTDRLTDASPDLMRSLLSTFIDAGEITTEHGRVGERVDHLRPVPELHRQPWVRINGLG